MSRRPPISGNNAQQKPKNMWKSLRRLISMLTKNPLPLIVVFVFLILSVATNLGGTYMLRGIINDFIYVGNTDMSGFVSALLVLLGVYLLSALATFCQSFFMVHLAQKSVNGMRRKLFDKLQKLPLSYFDRNPHGEVMSRFTNDMDNILTALEQSAVTILSSVLMFVGLVALMLFINWKLFLVTALVLVITLFTFKKMGMKSKEYYRQQMAATGAVNGNIQEMIEGLKVVKAFTHEETAKAEFKTLNQTFCTAASKANFLSSSIMPIASNLMNISYALTAAVGGALAVLQGFDLGGLIVYLSFSRQVGQPLNQIAQHMTVVLAALAGAERVFEIMDTQPEVDEGTITLIPTYIEDNGTLSSCDSHERRTWAWRVPKGGHISLVATPDNEKTKWAWRYPSPDNVATTHPIRGKVAQDEQFYYCELRGAVRFCDVDFSYVPEKRILKDVSLYANPGQKIAFVGSTGAGKTTITNLINRFYEIEGGLITYDGLSVRDIEKSDLRRSLGIVLQDTHLFSGSILDNIRYGRLDASDEACIAAAKSANAHSFIRRLPEGYHTEITGDGDNLSQGQRQLLAIARVAVADPPVMILDEATSSIDTRTEQQIERGMAAIMQGRTVFVIAHRLSTVRNADCIVVIEGGEIAEKGNHKELLELGGRYHALYTGQFQSEAT